MAESTYSRQRPWRDSGVPGMFGTMALVFQPPNEPDEANPDLQLLRGLILDPPHDYWNMGSGGATLRHGSGSTLLILPNDAHGIYLKFYDGPDSGEEEWLSLEDPSRLDEVAECSDEWNASIGLFLTPEHAWLAVEEFCQSGGRTEKIRWIQGDDLPEGGNW